VPQNLQDAVPVYFWLTELSVTADFRFLCELLVEHQQFIRRGIDPRAAVADHSELVQAISESLAEIRWSEPIPSVLRVGKRWWEAGNTLTQDDIERFVRLHLLLRGINAACRNVPLMQVPINGQILVVGDRWWDRVAQQGPIPLPVRDSYSFRNVQLADESQLLWSDAFSPGFFEKALGDCRLRIGLCPLDGRATTMFLATQPLEPNIQGVIAQKIEVNPSSSVCVEYIDELVDTVRWARENRVHILCFPELSVCPAGREAILKELRTDPGDLYLIVGGSFHEAGPTGSTRKINVAPIWLVDRRGGLRITELRQKKWQGFRSPSSALRIIPAPSNLKTSQEDILPSTSTCVINTRLGAFTFALGPDDPISTDLLNQAAAVSDHVVMMALGFTSTHKLHESAKASARRYGVSSYFINANQTTKTNAAAHAAFVILPNATDQEWFASGSSSSTSNSRCLMEIPIPVALTQLW
jgi:hypothetical protein